LKLKTTAHQSDVCKLFHLKDKGQTTHFGDVI
jgi:hypothetical protein